MLNSHGSSHYFLAFTEDLSKNNQHSFFIIMNIIMYCIVEKIDLVANSGQEYTETDRFERKVVNKIG